MDFLTNIVCTLLAYSPELLFTYVIVAAIIVFCGTDVGLEGISGRKKTAVKHPRHAISDPHHYGRPVGGRFQRLPQTEHERIHRASEKRYNRLAEHGGDAWRSRNLSPTARSHDPPHAMACPRSRIVVTGQYGDDALRHGDRRHDG